MEPVASEPHRLFDDSFLRFFPKPVREPRRAWLAIPLAFLLSLAGSLALATAVQSFMPALETPEFPMKGRTALFALVVFAPVVETFIMAGFITLFRLAMRDDLAVLASAVGWGIAHSLQAAAWGIAIWWPFLIFSTLYVVWRQRGFWVAVLVVSMAHGLQNLGPALTVAYPELLPAV